MSTNAYFITKGREHDQFVKRTILEYNYVSINAISETERMNARDVVLYMYATKYIDVNTEQWLAF